MRKYRKIVADYLNEYGLRIKQEHEFFEAPTSLDDAIALVASLKNPNNKYFSHQNRTKQHAKAETLWRLPAAKEGIAAADNFETLRKVVESALNIPGVGELMVYDVTCRIGLYLNLYPKVVYLHAGTKAGAEALGLTGKTAEICDFPEPFQVLTADALEDCLCIYKGQLAGKPEITSIGCGARGFIRPC